MAENLLKLINHANGDFNWFNRAAYSKPDENTLVINAPGKTDYFIDPAGQHIKSNAPFLYLDCDGDFCVQAHVAHDFKSVWDAAALMLWINPEKWAKVCFEATDFGTKAIVSVVTNQISDDANGVNYHWPDVWLQIIRQKNVFAFHYGPDGRNWNMVRIFALEADSPVKVGMVAQCPSGNGANIQFRSFMFKQKPINNLRAGI